MPSVTLISPATVIQAAPINASRNLRATIVELCNAQLSLLCKDLFDEADDFLFTSGRQGQFAQDSVYLKAMRELRSKQNLFEEAFLKIAQTTLFPMAKGANTEINNSPQHLIDRHAEVFEMLEVDLALKAMQRKADKNYSSIQNEVEALFSTLQQSMRTAEDRQFAVVESSLWAFGEAQRVFALPLDVRLVVIKLFEHHLLLKLEPLLLDVISVLKNSLKKNASPKGTSNVGQFADSASINLLQHPLSTGISRHIPAVSDSANVDLAVDAVISRLCAEQRLPVKVSELIETKWRDVLFLIGSHRGNSGADWKQAVDALQTLVASTSHKQLLADTEKADLFQLLRQGLEMLQTPAADQQKILQSIDECLLSNQIEANVNAITPSPQAVVAEASISPSGMQILDREDMQDLAKLLGDDSNEIASGNITEIAEKELTAFLPDIDALAEDVQIEYKLDGRFQTCSLRRNTTKPGMFNISDRHSRISITRSKMGLALSMQSGELRIAKTQFLSRAERLNRFE